MQATEQPCRSKPAWRRQRGVAAVEFALAAIAFFTIFFGVVELARAMYICNTLQEVTRMAAALAANTDFSNATAIQHVREKAVFRDSPGTLAFADPMSDAHVNIDYMWIQRDGTTMSMVRMPSLPASPVVNHSNCLNDPYNEHCIRLVRVRICQETDGATCTPVSYRNLTSLIAFPLKLPISTTITNAESLGMPAGVGP